MNREPVERALAAARNAHAIQRQAVRHHPPHAAW